MFPLLLSLIFSPLSSFPQSSRSHRAGYPAVLATESKGSKVSEFFDRHPLVEGPSVGVRLPEHLRTSSALRISGFLRRRPRASLHRLAAAAETRCASPPTLANRAVCLPPGGPLRVPKHPGPPRVPNTRLKVSSLSSLLANSDNSKRRPNLLPQRQARGARQVRNRV